ncbi:MAG: type II/IV secretion system protein [Prolixibacteraceae bacterium]|nr:type II/IV secretion system protein [Burkholderiales bacterium]
MAHIEEARAQAQASDRRIVEVLEESLGVPPAEFTIALAQALRFPALSNERMHSLAPAFDVLPFSEAALHECVLLRGEGEELLLAIGDPFALDLQAWAGERMTEAFTYCIAHRGDISAFLVSLEEGMRAMDGMVSVESGSQDALRGIEDLSLKAINENISPVVKLVNSTLYDALKTGASDVHLESTGGGLAIKYRIDGVLNNVGAAQGSAVAEQIISRIKVMAELDISEQRIPQDGRFKVRLKGREIDFRVSIMPSIFGEDAVLRILDKQALADEFSGLRVDALGFDQSTVAWFRKLAAEPYGMLLVTGPTGSGKTSTLYAILSEIHSGRDKIITIEDPVEYQLPGILQIPVNEKKGLTFARGLRSILRHDPDKIMVGEIRDVETAEIALQSALTGHLVFTTVHANNVFDVIGRFLHMGLDPYSFVSALNGVAAQRLVRINCPHCSVEMRPAAELLTASGIDAVQTAAWQFRAGKGCGQCRGSGYRGRKAIAETLTLNDEMRELISSRQPVRIVKEAARKLGTHTLREAALELLGRGETTLEEVNRVTFVA